MGAGPYPAGSDRARAEQAAVDAALHKMRKHREVDLPCQSDSLVVCSSGTSCWPGPASERHPRKRASALRQGWDRSPALRFVPDSAKLPARRDSASGGQGLMGTSEVRGKRGRSSDIGAESCLPWRRRHKTSIGVEKQPAVTVGTAGVRMTSGHTGQEVPPHAESHPPDE
jgi:hypothetical protein